MLGGVLAHIQAVLGRFVDPGEPLMEGGLDSLAAVELRNALASHWSLPLPATFIFDYPTAAAMALYCQAQLGMPDGQAVPATGVVPPAALQQEPARSGSAIVGVACRYPGATAGGDTWTTVHEWCMLDADLGWLWLLRCACLLTSSSGCAL